MEKTPDPEPGGICFGISLLALLGLGILTFFPWARQIAITPYPNVNGILISIALAGLVGVLLAIALRISRLALKLLKALVMLGLLAAALCILYLIALPVWKWLFSPR